MYIPAHFAADDAAVQDLLARHGAADLITLTEDGLLATMLPFAYEPAAGEHGTLLAIAVMPRNFRVKEASTSPVFDTVKSVV